MKVNAKLHFEFSQEDFQLIASFVDKCHDIESVFDDFNALLDVKNTSAELENAIGIVWEQFCEIVDLFQCFVRENMSKD